MRGLSLLGAALLLAAPAAAQLVKDKPVLTLDGARIVAGLRFDAEPLREQSVATRHRLDELVGRNDEHAEMLRQLEVQDDAIRQADENELPSGDELAAEVERFLREQDE